MGDDSATVPEEGGKGEREELGQTTLRTSQWMDGWISK